MSGSVLCDPPRTWEHRPYPALGAGCFWRCDCGAVYRAREFSWRALGWWMPRTRAMRRHVAWLKQHERTTNSLSALTPTDLEWLRHNGGAS